LTCHNESLSSSLGRSNKTAISRYKTIVINDNQITDLELICANISSTDVHSFIFLVIAVFGAKVCSFDRNGVHFFVLLLSLVIGKEFLGHTNSNDESQRDKDR